jgi:predicted RNA-binding Zn ribbon-like protein
VEKITEIAIRIGERMTTSHALTVASRPAPFFVGDHLALDFVNSTAAPWGERIEWLSNGADLVDWLESARAIGPEVASQFRADGDTFRALDAVAEQARSLRQWLQGFIERHEGTPLSVQAIEELQPLNRLLVRDETYRLVEAAAEDGSDDDEGNSRALRWRQKRRWTTPERLLQPIAEAIGDLVCDADFRLVRTCEGPTCTLVFYDRTKAHARRWCSMAVCGNRAKAAAHRAKLRQGRS